MIQKSNLESAPEHFRRQVSRSTHEDSVIRIWDNCSDVKNGLVKRTFKVRGFKHCNAEKYTLSSIHKKHMCRMRYTQEPHAVTIDI
jgi:hypothetical protein